MCSFLQQKGYKASEIHGNRSQTEREAALSTFKSGATPILVATGMGYLLFSSKFRILSVPTDVAARGLDIPYVSLVINYELPNSGDEYIHRTGRTGRAGKLGSAISFFNENNAKIGKSLIHIFRKSNQEVPEWLEQFVSSHHQTEESPEQPQT
jgi:ATP-dependent RNA helicase DDX3X